MLQILDESLKTIGEIHFEPGSSPFPEEENLRESKHIKISNLNNFFLAVLGKVYENVIFFGDFLLRMPDITKKVVANESVQIFIYRYPFLTGIQETQRMASCS